MDEDLESRSREELVGEVRRLREGIREHRDSAGHELCWHHPRLWGLLPEKSDPLPAVPGWPEFLRGCIRYRQSLDEQLPEATMRQQHQVATVPFDRFSNPEAYLEALKKLHPIVKGATVHKLFVDGPEACLLYDMETNTPAGTAFIGEWYQVRNGKIVSIRAVFDARPFAPMFSK